MDNSFTLSHEQIASFLRDGFLRFNTPLLNTNQLEEAKGIYDDLFSKKTGFENGHFFDLAGQDDELEALDMKMPQLLAPAHYSPELAKIMQPAIQKLSSILQQLFADADVQAGLQHLIMKPPHSSVVTPPHQDEAYWPADHFYNSVSIWMPLDAAQEEDGCLSFVPGTHRWDVLPHRSIGGNVKIHGLQLDIPDVHVAEITSKAVSCPLVAGGVTIHTNRTIHFAGCNSSAIPRRAVIMGGGTSKGTGKYYGSRSFPWNESKQAARQDREAKRAAI
jgi:hypothetical protein